MDAENTIPSVETDAEMDEETPNNIREQRLMRRLNTQSQDLIRSFGRMIRNFLGTAISRMNWESFCCLNWEKTTTAISSEGKKSACHMETANSTFLINSK